MRITNSIIRQNSLRNMQRNQQQVATAQEQVTSGVRLRRASDDPGAAGTTMQTRGRLAALGQYRRAIDVARSRTTEEEGALDSVEEILSRARELSVKLAGDSSLSSETRLAGAEEAQQLFRAAVAIGNTRLSDTYLFGGSEATTRPYEVTGTPGALGFATTSPSGAHVVEISDQQRVATTHSGTEVFEDTDALASLRDFANALTTGDMDGVRAATDRVRTAHESVLRVHVDLGTRVDFLDVTETNLDALEINLVTLKSSLEEVDIEKAVTELVGRQTALQAAMLATSRVMGLTLTDYLR